MTTLLQRDPQAWRDIRGLDTAEEIAQQPALWRELGASLQERFALDGEAGHVGDFGERPRVREIEADLHQAAS